MTDTRFRERFTLRIRHRTRYAKFSGFVSLAIFFMRCQATGTCQHESSALNKYAAKCNAKLRREESTVLRPTPQSSALLCVLSCGHHINVFGARKTDAHDAISFRIRLYIQFNSNHNKSSPRVNTSYEQLL